MIERSNKGSRIKENNEQRIVFERVEEFEIDSLEMAEISLINIESAIKDVDLNIESIKKHKETLEYERAEIEKFVAKIKKG